MLTARSCRPWLRPRRPEVESPDVDISLWTSLIQRTWVFTSSLSCSTLADMHSGSKEVVRELEVRQRDRNRDIGDTLKADGLWAEKEALES